MVREGRRAVTTNIECMIRTPIFKCATGGARNAFFHCTVPCVGDYEQRAPDADEVYLTCGHGGRCQKCTLLLNHVE